MPSLRLRDMSLELGLSFRQKAESDVFWRPSTSGGTRRGIYLLRGLHREFVQGFSQQFQQNPCSHLKSRAAHKGMELDD
jgi:hypothetical protein